MIVKGFVLALLLLAQFVPSGPRAPVASSGITYVTTCDNGGSGVTSIGCTVTGVPAGATIVFMVTGSGGATSATDSGGGTPTQIGTNQTWSSGSEVANLWYVKNAASGSHTLTGVFGAVVNYTRFQVLVFAGANTTSPLDTFALATGSGGTVSSGSMTTSNANEMLAGFIVGTSVTAITAGSPPSYTIVHAGTGAYFAGEYAIASTASTYAATAGITPSSATWVVLAVALKQ